jgi:signal transduction histidine kinase
VGSVFAALEPLLLQASPGPELAALKAKMETEDFAYLLEEAPRAIDQSLEGLTRIATIVKAMKIFGHPGAEGKTDVNLNEALENTLVVTQSEWKYLAEVRTNLASGLPLVLGSLGELNQVFLNLIVNAAHAIEEKGLAEKGLISIATRAAGAEVEFQITDTGAGIPESIRDRVFLPFFTTKAVGKGTGQGLALAHAIIAKHGGAISFTSQLGEGTCFTIRLPAVAAP